MSNYDQFAAAVKEISGGKNVVLLDDLGLPSVYVPINKLKLFPEVLRILILHSLWMV